MRPPSRIPFALLQAYREQVHPTSENSIDQIG
jgi:hypothetical protein